MQIMPPRSEFGPVETSKNPRYWDQGSTISHRFLASERHHPRAFMAPGASVFDSKVLCQEMSIAARRSGMLDAGLLLVSYTGEVPFQLLKWKSREFRWGRFTVGGADFCTEKW